MIRLLLGPRGPRMLGLALAAVALMVGCRSDEGVEDPTPLYGEVPVHYPLDLWDQEVEGETLLRVRVTETGAVDSAEVLQSSGYPAFDSAALRGARGLRYSPARKDGRRVAVWAKVPIEFSREGS